MTSAVFPSISTRSGMYESFYLRAVSPTDPLGVWIRYTVHKPPGERPRGSLWCTVFDPHGDAPFMARESSDRLRAPAGGWIEVGDAHIDASGAVGTCGGASWSLHFTATEPELRHLPWSWMYRAPLPRTKLTSPLPAARFNGTVEVEGRMLELRDWSGMVGHNWGAEHAARWVWLHGVNFEGAPEAWLDVAIAQLRVAGRMTPWIANGVLSLDGRRHRLGGLGARGLLVAETASRCKLVLPGSDGLQLEARVRTPARSIAAWRYDDPAGGEHNVSNCSIAALELIVQRQGLPTRTLRCAHGAAYELGTPAA